MNKFLVITSIAGSDNKVLKTLDKKAQKEGVEYILIGDRKSPQNVKFDHCEFYSVEQQEALPYSFTKICPYDHYTRKNIGYLIAIDNNAEIIYETDDDNIPYDTFWKIDSDLEKTCAIKGEGWINVYQYFTKKNVWPRGLPLDDVRSKYELANSGGFDVDTPIIQGLADDNPDVDAIYRFIGELPVKFEENIEIILKKNQWCPFNSQNTIWKPKAFPLLYLPATCSFRMTDIWRSFIAQRIGWEYDWGILFRSPTVNQERNEHNIYKDFEDEISGYLNNKRIGKELSNLELSDNYLDIYSNLKKCYELLHEMELVEPLELKLLDLWIKDLKRLNK